MQSFIRRKNIEHLTKQLAGGQLDAGQCRYAEKRLAEELASQRADQLAGARALEPEPEVVPLPADGSAGKALPC